MAQYKTRDPHNPYRTGVLVGNYVEDKFGSELAAKEKECPTGITMNQTRMNENNSLMVYDIPKKTQQDLLEEKEYKDFA